MPSSEPLEWSTACPDWERRILAGESLIPFEPLFPDQAAAAFRVLNELVLVDVAGSPTMGDIMRPWLRDWIGAIFGAYDADAGRRLINEFFFLISKKNTKSTSAAGVMLTALILNWRLSGEFIILAPTVEIANNAFHPARDMVKADDELRDLMHTQEHYRTITNRKTGATLKVVAADNEAVGGKKAIGVLIDEAWLFGKKPNAENMIREATGGLASRPEGFTIWLSTQSDEPPAGIFRQKLQYARAVRDGTIVNRKFLPVIYEFPEAMVKSKAYLDPANFHITNPNLGASVDPEFLIGKLEEAQFAGEESVCGFLAKHLNVEIGLALRSDRWAGADFWESQGDRSITLDAILQRCDVIDIGIDGGGLDDLLGLAVLGRDTQTRDWLLWTHAWAHPSVLERRKSEAARLQGFAKDGDLTLVQRIGDDVAEVTEIVKRVDDSGFLDKIGVDPAGLGSILESIADAEVDPDKVIGISQGWKLNGAIKTGERSLAEGTLIHGGQPLMAWCVGNAKVEPRGNAVLITKQASGTAKIDPLMAAFSAITLMSLNPAPRGDRAGFFASPVVVA